MAETPTRPFGRRSLLLLLVFATIAFAPLLYGATPLAAQEADPAAVEEEPGAFEELLDDAASLLQGDDAPTADDPAPAQNDVAPVDEAGGLTRPQAPQITLPDVPDTPGAGGTVEETEPAVTVVVLLTALALIPTVLILATSFTRMIIVFGLTRNALGLQGIPNNQVLIGLSLFLTLFVMAPVLTDANENALQPFLDGEIEQSEALESGIEPFREFMLAQVRDQDLQMFIDLSGEEITANADDIALTTLVPAFIVGELRAAFLIGFIIFVPFLVIDLVTAAALMSMGMMMLPPVVISLPFKLLLFVMVDGWFLLVPTLVESYNV